MKKLMSHQVQVDQLVHTWEEEPARMKSIPFIKGNSLLVNLLENDYFRLLVDDDLLNNIIVEINHYALEVFLNTDAWVHTNAAELQIGRNRLQDYWCFHFARNPGPNEDLPNDRLFKILPVLNYFNNKIQAIYYPGRNLRLDESMVLWRDRLLFKQYIRNKRHKYVYSGQLEVFDGTLRADRKGSLKDVVKAKLKREATAKYLDGVMEDKRDATYISMQFENTIVEVRNRRGQEKLNTINI
ncbi:hypothetical protein ILUMI_16773 [Ignelater luminosus]|uniref:PiggyBac transposable element-derived protein domain-containing protein n=1 Tax=Ignelater luminosus TaxID=2038154 RepID=A0A8K0CLA6_IGNLU|nr:hypothetical protein ILUMI_16773 [Ignelater luminosus]